MGMPYETGFGNTNFGGNYTNNMRLKKLRLENHPLLKNLQLDFTDESGHSVDTIILAGENGTGKTSILDLLYEFSFINVSNEKRDEKRFFEIELSAEELKILSSNESYKHFFSNGFSNGNFTITFDFNIIGSWNQIKVSFHDSAGKFTTINGDFIHQPEIRPIFTVIYSDVEINYTPNQIKSVTAKDLDEKKSQSFKSDGNLATEITQLIIDIQALDAQDFSQWAKKNIGSQIDQNEIDKRIKRFTRAFDIIFPAKRFLGIENRKGNKEVLFEENGYKMPIDKLSSGEKQIVFRGGFLLKDKGANKGAVILIDEPEISLHPKWQLEILDFYKNIINSESDIHSQIFISTHSPFIIHNPNRRNDKVIILTKSADGQISTLTHSEFYSWTNSKIVKEAFQIDYNFETGKNKLFVEGETDEKYLNKARELFSLDSNISFAISWIGRINEKGGTEFTGDTALNQARSFFLANSDLLHSKVILYYDSDTNKPEETYDKLIVRKMPQNTENSRFKIGIENLLTLPDDFDYSQFYSEKSKIDEYGAESIIRTLDKTKLCEWVCEKCKAEEQLAILKQLSQVLIDVENSLK